MQVSELIAVGLLNRPELGAQRAMIAEAMISLEGSKVLPFSPTVIAGFSAGVFGGGSNLVRPIFGGFGGRSDLDVITYWTLRNFGIGNVAMIRLADAHLQMARFEQIRVLNLVRAEVAEAYAKAHARFAQITASEQAVQAGREAFREDYERTLARAEREVLPIELLNSFRLLAQSRHDYLDSIVDYDRTSSSSSSRWDSPRLTCWLDPFLPRGSVHLASRRGRRLLHRLSPGRQGNLGPTETVASALSRRDGCSHGPSRILTGYRRLA